MLEAYTNGVAYAAPARHWLVRAERRDGLPKFERGRWHPWRWLFAAKRTHLPEVGVEKAAGWGDLCTMKQSHQRPEPATAPRVVGGGSAGYIVDRRSAQVAAR
jgi:hypothetical protein